MTVAAMVNGSPLPPDCFNSFFSSSDAVKKKKKKKKKKKYSMNVSVCVCVYVVITSDYEREGEKVRKGDRIMISKYGT